MFVIVFSIIAMICAIIWGVLSIIETYAEDEPRPIAEDVRRVKIKDKPWVKKYFNGEFDPEPNDEQESEPIAETKTIKPLRKIVIRKKGATI